jgi:hypothetical protein
MEPQGMRLQFPLVPCSFVHADLALTLKPPSFAGKVHILDRVVDLVALHKEGFIFPVTICVTRASGSGADATFMGVIKVTGRLW